MEVENDARWKVAPSLRLEDRNFVQVMVEESVVRCPGVINQRNLLRNFVLSMEVERNVSTRAAKKLLVVKPSFVLLMVVEFAVNWRDATALL